MTDDKEDYFLLLEDLLRAYRSASKNKRWKKDCIAFDFDYELELCELARQIQSFDYQIRPSKCFIVSEPVYREVLAADFRDRIVHHYICHYIEEHLEALLIEDCYSCRKGKGTSYGVDRLEHHIRSASENYTKTCYVLQLDISAYFMSIDRKLLLTKVNTLMKHIGEKKNEVGRPLKEFKKHHYITYLLEQLISHDCYANSVYHGNPNLKNKLPQSKSLKYAKEGCGLPIGNLTSQFFSNLYLNEFDHYIKRVLKVKHYGRYVDDFYLIDNNPQTLVPLIEKIRLYLLKHCRLVLHPKKIKIQEVKKGVSFLGMHLKPYRRYTTRDLSKRISFKVNKLDLQYDKCMKTGDGQQYLRSSCASYWGIFEGTASYKFRESLFQGKLRTIIARLSLKAKKK